MKLLRHVRPFLYQWRWRYATGILVLLFTDLLQLVTPKLIQFITDQIESGDITPKKLSWYALWIVLAAVGVAYFRYRWRMNIMGSSRTMEYWLRNRFFSHLETLDQDFYNHQKTGDLMAHATNDIQAVRMAFGPGVVMMTDSLFQTAVTVLMMVLTISPSLSVIAMLPLPFLAIIARLMGKSMQKKHKRIQESFSELSDTVQESIAGIRTLKTFLQEESQTEKFAKTGQTFVKHNMDLALTYGFMNPLIGLIASSSFILALYFGGGKVIQGEITLGELMAFISYLGMLTWPMMAIGWVINGLQRGVASLKRLNEIFDRIPAITDGPLTDTPASYQRKGASVSFEDVTFTYPGASLPALQSLHFKIEPGKTLAVIGPTGSGKSTLASLLLRFYEPQKGKVLFQDINIQQLPLGVLRQNIAMVPQDSFLFSDTIAQNIAFGVSSASLEDIIDAAQKAAVHADIMEFPEGYQTPVGEKGVTLSGGQKQRISIARALLKNPSVLVLDDALSAVDTKTEESILQALEESTQGTTRILISHRISAIQEADEIFYMEQGQIVERGTHSSLLALNGRYASLERKQALAAQAKGARE